MIKFVGPNGVVIEAPADSWRICECGPVSDVTDASDLCDDCRQCFEQSLLGNQWPEPHELDS